MTVDFAIVGKVEGGDFVPLGNHAQAAFGSGSLDMLLKGIEIAHRRRVGNRRKKYQLVQRVFPGRSFMYEHRYHAKSWFSEGRLERRLVYDDFFSLTFNQAARPRQALGVAQQFQYRRVVKREDTLTNYNACMRRPVWSSESDEFH